MRAGRLDGRLLLLFAKMQQDRGLADYGTESTFTAAQADEAVTGAGELLAAARELVARAAGD